MNTATNTSFRAAVMVALFCLTPLLSVNPHLARAQQPAGFESLVIETATGPKTFTIEIAKTNAQKAQGLMFRSNLKRGHAMLFPHDKPKTLTMWMKNTYISLDMIFIAADGRVFRIEERTQPHSTTIISSNGSVTGVLEIGGGEAARLNIRQGDLVRHSHFKAQSQAR